MQDSAGELTHRVALWDRGAGCGPVMEKLCQAQAADTQKARPQQAPTADELMSGMRLLACHHLNSLG